MLPQTYFLPLSCTLGLGLLFRMFTCTKGCPLGMAPHSPTNSKCGSPFTPSYSEREAVLTGYPGLFIFPIKAATCSAP